MNVQQSPRKPSAEIAPYLDQIDRAAAGDQTIARREPPSFGEAQRGAIDSVVVSLVTDLSKRIGNLRSILDRIEQQVLESAERSKAALERHVAVCVRVDDEIRAMQTVVDDLAKDTDRNQG